MMSSATITSKGQITLPADIRREFRMKPGDRLLFFKDLTGDLRLHVNRKRVGAGRGSLEGAGIEVSRETIGEAGAEGVASRRSSRRGRGRSK
jgi:AbrB family looped-hinge helix DNA binding protein